MIRSLLTGIVALTGLVIIWQIAVTATGVPRFILPAPGLVLKHSQRILG